MVASLMRMVVAVVGSRGGDLDETVAAPGLMRTVTVPKVGQQRRVR